jgi:hypothetical protein
MSGGFKIVNGSTSSNWEIVFEEKPETLFG